MTKRTSHISRNKCVGGFLKSKKGGKLSIHYNGDKSNAELLFRTIISVNQLSIFEAISDWCGEVAQQISDHWVFQQGETRGEEGLNNSLDCRLSLAVLSCIETACDRRSGSENLLRSQNERFETLPEDE